MSGMRTETEEKYKEICRLHAEGKKKAEIVEALHCATSTIDRAIKLCGEKRRRDTFEDHKDTIIRLYDAGVTAERIAEETGLSANTIHRNLRAMGFRRGRGWQPAGSKGWKQIHRVQEETEEEVDPRYLQYAQHTRKAERIVIRGKTYLDVSAWYM